jgi:putative hydrolase of the HAD superfamily
MLVLFDIDDTLIDHSTAVRAAVSELYWRIESPLPHDAFLASWLAAMREHYPRYLSGDLTYEDQRRARIRQTVDPRLPDRQADELFGIYFGAYEARWALFPDVRPCLDDLAGHHLGIISNGNGAEQRSKLRRTGIAKRFEVVHISADYGYAKPAPEIFRRACETANC